MPCLPICSVYLRFRSDPSMIGTEMLSIISPLGSSSMLDGPYKQLDPLHPDRGELRNLPIRQSNQVKHQITTRLCNLWMHGSRIFFQFLRCRTSAVQRRLCEGVAKVFCVDGHSMCDQGIGLREGFHPGVVLSSLALCLHFMGWMQGSSCTIHQSRCFHLSDRP